MKSIESTYYVLLEDAAQEEPMSWESIEEKCRAGEISPGTRIFFPDKNKWIRAGDTDLKEILGPEETAGAKAATDGEDSAAAAEAEALEVEYQEALRSIEEKPEAVEAYVQAGRLAAERGDRGAAREHFQGALRLKPFHSRVAQEVYSRFSKSECKKFLYLRRQPPVWEDPADLLTFPLGAGPLYLLIPAAVLFVLAMLPFGAFVAAPLAYLWVVQVARHAAEGSTSPPQWNRMIANPAREIILPLLAGALVAAECALFVYGVGRLGMLASGEGGGAFRSVVESPVLSVALAVFALIYLPAVLVKIVHSVGIVVHLLNPLAVIRSMVRMEQEYAVSALAVVIIGFVMGGVNFLVGGIPVLGSAVLAAVVAFAIPVVGLILGRLVGRSSHVL
jgi:hypothetical protein